MKYDLQRKRIDTFTEEKLFSEMQRIWKTLGHRPSRTEWEMSDASIHYNTYRRRYGGWINACIKFIEYQMGTSLSTEISLPQSHSKSSCNKRDIPLKLRLKVLNQDGFTCVYCGKSPALDRGVSLHIDHRIPFSRGGKTTIDNLQTLCSECNLGKGNQT